MANFYLREDLDGVAVDDEVELVGAEAKHMATVSRTRVGESILIGNGRGMVAGATVLRVEPSRVTLRADVVDVSARSSPRVTLVQALAKGGRDELAVQVATELGVDAIVPWSAARSISRWDAAKATKGRDRWSAIAREATKQSIRPWLPEVEPLVSTGTLIQRAGETRMLVLEPTADAPLSAVSADERDLIIVVGPEGGLSATELEDLQAGGAQLVRLGTTVLRTSSAGPAALAVVNTILRRW